MDELPKLAGGREARDAIQAFLDKYGMRCVGEIDITRPRWSERPTTLVPLILGNIKNFEPGAGERRFEQGRQEAWEKEQELLARVRDLPDGERKADETKRMIDRVRTFIGYREYPKYGMVSRYFVYKQALLEEAERLVQAHVLREKEDIFYLTFQELHDVVRTNQVDDQLIGQRKDAFRSYQALTPPRVLTSDGEVVAGSVPTRRCPGRRAGRPTRFRRNHRGAGPRHPGHGGGRSRSGRHPGHRLYGPQLDAGVRRDHRPCDGGGGPDDPWRGDRTGVRLAGGSGRGASHPADPGWAADPRQWDGRVRRDPALGALRAAHVDVGKSVLVTAAAGVVGHVAVQLARILGAKRVVATVGSTSEVALMRRLGVDEIVVYNQPDTSWHMRRSTSFWMASEAT